MQEFDTVHPDYQKGFNEGYELSKLAPEIAETLSKVESKSERINGFKDGRNEFLLEKEKIKEFLPSWLKKDIATKPNKEKGKGKDKADLDRE